MEKQMEVARTQRGRFQGEDQYRSFKNICKVWKIPHWCRIAYHQEEYILDVNYCDVRFFVLIVLVHDGSMLLVDVCGLLWNLLVHQEVGHCSERQKIKVTGYRVTLLYYLKI